MFETDGLKRGRFYHNKSRLRSLRQGYPAQLDYNKETLIRVRIPRCCIRQVVKSPAFHAGIQRFESFMQY